MKECNNCGKCCTSADFMGSLSATERDVRRWKREGREDILEFVDETTGDLWITPNGYELSICPFVAREGNSWFCSIYSTRPEVCRGYPSGIEHMISIGCEMIEPGDEKLTTRKAFQQAVKNKSCRKLKRGKVELESEDL
jgi:Fe-S-cluster containining protein